MNQADPTNRLLAELGPHDLEALASQLRPLPLQQGVVLQEQGLPVETVYFPLGGLISLVVVTKAGDTIEIAMIGREGAVGLFAGLGRWRAFARAVVQIPGIALSIPARQFQD